MKRGKNILKVGLTGGIASGKSAVAKFLATDAEVEVVDADRVAWETYNPGTDVYEKLIERFGQKILNDDQTINRKAVSDIVFQNEEERQFLNSIVHPAIYERLFEMLARAEKAGKKIFIVEAALLLEKRSQGGQFFDCFVMTLIEDEVQLERVMERDQITADEAQKKIEAQMPQAEKAKLADILIENYGTLEELEKQTDRVLSRLKEMEREQDS